MATKDRDTNPPLTEALEKQGSQFSFFQLVHLMERAYKNASRIGGVGPAQNEVIRFAPDPSLSFAKSDIASVVVLPKTAKHPERIQVVTTFMGLYGATSPLPTFYTESILDQERERGGREVRTFLDLFHHRIISLFYRCWAKYRYHVEFESGGKDPFSEKLFGLIGLGTDGLKENTGLPPVLLLRYAGLLTQQPRSATALSGILSDCFGDLPVQIESCMGQWVTIESDQMAVLGRCQLGVDSSIGQAVLSRTSRFRIVIGPIPWNRFSDFLPGARYFKTLNAITRFFVGNRFDFDVELKADLSEIPRVQLGIGSYLGWTTWLKSEEGGKGMVSLRLSCPVLVQ